MRIAGEGRKFGLYLLVSTQRPQKVHENVLTQCDNLVLMRMNSAADLGFVGDVFSFVPPSLLERATTFRQGESLVGRPRLLLRPRASLFGPASTARAAARPRPRRGPTQRRRRAGRRLRRPPARARRSCPAEPRRPPSLPYRLQVSYTTHPGCNVVGMRRDARLSSAGRPEGRAWTRRRPKRPVASRRRGGGSRADASRSAASGSRSWCATFAFFLPKLADYRDVWAVVKELSWPWIVALLVAAALNVVTFAPPWMVALPGLASGRR